METTQEQKAMERKVKRVVKAAVLAKAAFDEAKAALDVAKDECLAVMYEAGLKRVTVAEGSAELSSSNSYSIKASNVTLLTDECDKIGLDPTLMITKKESYGATPELRKYVNAQDDNGRRLRALVDIDTKETLTLKSAVA